MKTIKIGPVELYGCTAARERLEPFIDHELDSIQNRRVRVHLWICHECSVRFGFERTLQDGLRSEIETVEMPASLAARVEAKLDEISSQ